MIATLRTAALALLASAPFAFAQTADSNDVSDGELSLGEPETTIGSTYVRETFGDWELRCVKSESGQDPCQLYQLLADGEGNNVAEVSIFNLPAEQQATAGATVITPLETLLTQQLRIAVDGGQPKRYPYAFCSAVGCFARIGFTQEEIDAFKRGAAATMTIVPAAAPDQTVDLAVSLTGFTAGWDAVNAANATE